MHFNVMIKALRILFILKQIFIFQHVLNLVNTPVDYLTAAEYIVKCGLKRAFYIRCKGEHCFQATVSDCFR